MPCPGSKRPPAGVHENRAVRYTDRAVRTQVRVLATRGTCAECGRDVALSRPRSRQPTVRVH